MSYATMLPVLPLPFPTLLLPGSRINMFLSKSQADLILSLFQQESEFLPVIATVPLFDSIPATAFPSLPQSNEWGCVARVLRLVRPVVRGGQHMISIQGLTRIQLNDPIITASNSLDVTHIEVSYPSEDSPLPSREVISSFRSSARKFLTLLQRRSTQDSQTLRNQNVIFGKIATVIEDVTDDRAAWAADLLIGAIPSVEWNDKLALLSTPKQVDRLTLATQVLHKLTAVTEVAANVASRVDQSLSNQQKEYFLRQQLSAIQRELKSLHGNSDNKSSSPTPSSGQSDDLENVEEAEENDLAAIKAAIEKMQHGSEERKMGAREYRRLKRIPSGSVENGVIRSYLEWLTSLPWPNSDLAVAGSVASITSSNTKPFLTQAREQLDVDHFGLEKIKRRLIEYLAVERLRERQKATLDSTVSDQSNEKALVPLGKVDPATSRKPPSPTQKSKIKGPILLFCGPPGVGKTSLGQSIARVLDRPFQRISLGGVRDEAEIRGHRRTYVASGPGLIVQALRKMGTSRGVLLLDEVDKIAHNNFHGDPAAALLEVLDPEQNNSFNDHYVNVPIDLSQMLFICTANSLETISRPLLDRCEVIELAGYTYDEKLHIARRFLLPKQLSTHGLTEDQVNITDEAMKQVATEYTREAGVRSLERNVGSIVRFKAVHWAEFIDEDEPVVSEEMTNHAYTPVVADSYNRTPNGGFVLGTKLYYPTVEAVDLEEILGIARWDENEREREERRGLIYGLVVMGQGEGGILPVETIAVPGRGALKLTGSLGDVIKESAELALSWVKRHAYDLNITNESSQDPLKSPDVIDIHLHLPSGAQKKDGPSAGVAMTCAFVSLLTGACVSPNVAMTGEITLRGRVTPVGGIKEKVHGAHRAQMVKVILPYANKKDVEQDVSKEIRDQMEFVFVRTLREALDAAFGKNALPWRRQAPLLLESRL